MPPTASRCPECGGQSCDEHFYQMLAWEQSDLERYGSAHHLMVLCFYLQHPSRYSPEGLRDALKLLVDFVEHGQTPRQARVQNSATLDSNRRKFKITGTPQHHGAYRQPVRWGMTAADLVAAGLDHFVANVHAWSRSVLASLRESGDIG